MEVAVESNTQEEPSQYFSASTTKFLIMSLCTMGGYELYWFYKNWVHIKKKNSSDIMPFWRTCFAPLWAYSAFNDIRNELKEQGIAITLQAGMLATIYFLLSVVWQLPAPYWLIGFLSIVPLLPANTAATRINEKVISDFQQNSKIKGWNWLAVILGGPLFVLSVVGSFITVPS